MANDAILCIDQGTTNSKAILLDRNGRIVASGSAPLAISHPQPGWVEQSANDIWTSVLQAIHNCLQQAQAFNVLAIGISNQRESVVLWDAKSHEPLAPAITWQCRRTTDTTNGLIAAGHQQQVLNTTGLPLDPLFPASKINWLLQHSDSADRRVGTVDSWLIWKLTGGECFATDRSNASRTQLLNVQSGQWDESLCELFGVQQALLPEVVNSKHHFGITRGVPGISDGVPINAAIGDSHAALFGHAATTPGAAKATFGTGSSVMMVTPDFRVPEKGMTTTIAWSIDSEITYALEGNILVSASLFPWVATLLGMDGDVDQLMQLAQSVDETNGVALVPALVGLGAPHWSPQARGQLSGLSFASEPAHIAHAACLSMSLQTVDVFQAMYQQAGTSAGEIYVDGGPTRNRFLMQQLADLLAHPVNVCGDPELSAMGAGMLAGLEAGLWSDLEEIASLERRRELVKPTMIADKRSSILSTWQDAVAKCVR